MNQDSKTGVNTEVSARVIRADGTIEDLGIIASSKNKTVTGGIIGRLKDYLNKKEV